MAPAPPVRRDSGSPHIAGPGDFNGYFVMGLSAGDTAAQRNKQLLKTARGSIFRFVRQRRVPRRDFRRDEHTALKLAVKKYELKAYDESA